MTGGKEPVAQARTARPHTAATRLVCLLGHPVGHSVSPQIHNAAFAATGFDAAYLAFDAAPERLEHALVGLEALGFLGANVTVPHKRAVWEVARRRTPEAEAIGAANTLFWDGPELVADNTDARGLEDVLARDVGLRPGEGVVLFGAGGAARAAAVALGRSSARVEVHARRSEAAAAVGRLAAEHGATLARVDDPRLIVNATPLGLHGERLPDHLMSLHAGQVALDLVYGPEPTPFLLAAGAAGAAAFDGLGMLVAQAAGSFERWTGIGAPRDVMEQAARAALGR